jgi:fibronectin type 3 domain-containing protein
MPIPTKSVRLLGLSLAVILVTACGGGGSVLGAPEIPTNFVGIPQDGQAVLTWNPSNGATHYNVKRSLDSAGPYVVIGGPNVPAYTDTGLTNGTTYYYVVSADGPLGESGNSNVQPVTPRP